MGEGDPQNTQILRHSEMIPQMIKVKNLISLVSVYCSPG